jgi:hypothetical protein
VVVMMVVVTHHVMMMVMPHHVMMAVVHHVVVGFRRVWDRLHLRGGKAGGEQERSGGGERKRSEFHGRLLQMGLVTGPLIRPE